MDGIYPVTIGLFECQVETINYILEICVILIATILGIKTAPEIFFISHMIQLKIKNNISLEYYPHLK